MSEQRYKNCRDRNIKILVNRKYTVKKEKEQEKGKKGGNIP